MKTLTCVKCREHYEQRKESLDFAFSAVGFTCGRMSAQVAEEYFASFHARGHRKALRDD